MAQNVMAQNVMATKPEKNPQNCFDDTNIGGQERGSEEDLISHKSFHSCNKLEAKSSQTNVETFPTLCITKSNEVYPVFSALECRPDLMAFPSECCRICHEKEDVEFFISPCYCRGTMLQVHQTCLEAWLAESDSRRCELCGYVFNCIRIPKYNIMESIYAWFSTAECIRERKLLISDAFLTVGLSPIVLIFTIVALKIVGADIIDESNLDENGEPISKSLFALTIVFQSVLLGLMFLVDLSFISWLIMRCDFHVKNWYKWYRRKSTVILVDLQGPNRRERLS